MTLVQVVLIMGKHYLADVKSVSIKRSVHWHTAEYSPQLPKLLRELSIRHYLERLVDYSPSICQSLLTKKIPPETNLLIKQQENLHPPFSYRPS